MKIHNERVAGVAVLRLSGAHTHHDPCVRAHVERVLGDGVRLVVLDLEGVTQLDAPVLGELVRIHGAIRRWGGQLMLSHVPRRLHYLLAASSLESVFHTAPSEDDAVARLVDHTCQVA